MTGRHGDPHFGVLHILSSVCIFGGFLLLSVAWNDPYRAQRRHQLATTGIYARIRHPQYIGFIAIMFGFLLQWPTILMVLMFPLLVWMYVHLALSEERDAEREFGETYTRYAAAPPRWIPHWGPPEAAAHLRT